MSNSESSVKFDLWNEKKKLVEASGRYPYFSRGEIWWAQIGQNISTEVDGKGADFFRPVIVFQKVYGNSRIVIPLTSKARRGDYYFSFYDSRDVFQCALLTQIRYPDGKRLKYKQSSIKKEGFIGLRIAFLNLINKNPV